MKLVFWDQGVKAHLVSDDLFRVVDGDLRQRFRATRVESIDKAGETFRIDRGGSMLLSATWVSVDLDGTTLEVPARDLQSFYVELMDAPVRIIQGTHHGYYKLHGELHCVVLSSQQRKKLMRAWGMALDVARREAQDERDRLVAGSLQSAASFYEADEPVVHEVARRQALD